MAANFLRVGGRRASPPDWDGAKGLSQTALDDAVAFQAPGGGMTFFVPADRYQSPYLSAYTALASGWLQSMGYQPPVAVWDKLDDYLQALLREDITVSGYGSADMGAKVRATALAALAHRGRLNGASLQPSQPPQTCQGQV